MRIPTTPCYDSTSRGRAMNVYLFGDHAAEIVARDTPRWDAWFQERFPMPTALDESE